MSTIAAFMRYLIRFFIAWFVVTVSLVITSRLMPGISIDALPNYPAWAVASAAALVLALVNLFIRPLILLLAVPLGFIAVFVLGFFVNSIMLWITARLIGPSFDISGWLPAIIAGFVLGIVGLLVNTLLGVEDTGAFYQGLIERRLTRQRVEKGADDTIGLVMLEIDGLSYHHMRKAIDDGYMPNVWRMLEREGYLLSSTDCGLPSQTSACQTGILFGDNYDIPAFRWYDKAQRKLFVSGNDAAEINARYARGEGLLRGGASVNNMMNGDARIALLTASDLRDSSAEDRRDRAQDIYLLLLNPNFLVRVFGMFIGEAIREVYEYTRDVAAGTQPRLNRLHKFYPFIRAVTTVFMREVSGLLTVMQIVRGEPAIYTTWPGYDEVAHHSGPWSKHAFNTLRGFDRYIGVVREFIETKTSRPYELYILSDHGQSFGPTFLMRYGYTLKEFIERHMPEGTVINQTLGGDDGSISVASTAAELSNVQSVGVGGRVGQATARQMRKAAATQAGEHESALTQAASEMADVTFCGSGNLGQVYFHTFDHRVTAGELSAAFPGLLEAVLGHEGVGLLIALDDDRQPVVYGKQGKRNLHTGEIAGQDPLLPYGEIDKRAWQLKRLADFPSSGDLIIVSTLYPDGTVAALEELIGNHGGLGGEQTDSFLIHPRDMEVPPTRSSVDMFALLNARRGRPPQPKAAVAPTRARDDWAMGNLLAGIRAVGDWTELALRALILDRTAYRAIATFALMTGPALLLSLLGLFVVEFMAWRGAATGWDALAVRFVARYVVFLVTVLLLHGAARILRGKAEFTQTFRVMGFIQVVGLWHLLRFIPALDGFIAIPLALLVLLATWLGVAEAHRLRGWRTLLLPILYLVIFAGSFLAVAAFLSGFGMTLELFGQGLFGG